MSFDQYYFNESFNVEETVTINDLFDGDVPQDEYISEYGYESFDKPLKVFNKSIKDLTTLGGDNLLDLYKQYAKPNQKKIVNYYLGLLNNNKENQIEPIIVDGNRIVDGNHRAVAYMLLNKETIKAVDLNTL